ncbi:hypothetical protein [Tessaracoccus lubricantis]
MPSWLWFVIVLGVGLLILAAAVLLDRRQARRLTGAGEPAPRRGHAEVDTHVPHYVTQDEIDDLPSPAAGHGRELPKRGEGFGFGHAHPDFATNPDGASYAHPLVLVVDGELTAMRELLAPLKWATSETPLVVVAAGLHPEVLATLAANRRALGMPVLAAAANRRDRRRLAELTGAEELSVTDLQAGYVPHSALGRARHWSSTGTRTWVEAG